MSFSPNLFDFPIPLTKCEYTEPQMPQPLSMIMLDMHKLMTAHNNKKVLLSHLHLIVWVAELKLWVKSEVVD